MYTYTLIHVCKNPVKVFLENRFRSGQVDYFGVQKEVGWFMVFNATFNNIKKRIIYL
jgi:hypothetical protein